MFWTMARAPIGRQQLLTAARDELVRGNGVLELSALTRRAQLSTGALYHHFKSKEALLEAVKEVKNGKQLSQILEEGGLYPAIVPQMLAVGEETGETATVLVKVADFYEEEVDTAIGSLSSIIEPIMIVVMGGAVGLIAASVMGPIAGLATQIK